MIRFFVTISLLLLTLGVWAQGSKFSPAAQNLLRETESYRNSPTKTETTLPEAVVRKYHLRQQDGRYLVSGLLKVEAGTDNTTLEAAGAQIRTSTRTIRTFSVPLEALPALAEVAGVKFVQIDEGAKKKLKEAIAETNTGTVHTGGGGLPQAFDGTGVIVGVIDGGFDPKHPAFRSADGGRMRVVRYKRGDQSLETEAAILAADPDEENNSHGTHVAGISSGSNWKAPEAELTGYAPGSDLVFATLGGDNLESAVLEAAEYIFTYATAQGKPAVINMSLGSHLGPHDGTSLLDQGFDELIEGSRGRVLVGAAGNEGLTPLYLEHTFAANDTIKTIVQFEGSEIPYLGNGQIDIWGTPDKEFMLGTQVIDALTGETLFVSEEFASSTTGGEFMHSYEVDEDNGAGTMGTVNPRFVGNNQPNIRLQAANNLPAYVVIWLTGEAGSKIRLWNHGLGSAGGALVDTLEGGIVLAGARKGSTSSTMGEIGGTGRSVITVGAYTTLNRYETSTGTQITIDLFAEVGELAPFSSRGPTADGRIKPDITAPGNVVVAAGASFTLEKYLEANKVVHTIDEGGTTYPYLAFEGTSMATPGISGVVALMLQANPNLSFAQVKSILQSTARSDAFTGSIPAAGNNTWGRGKVDALAALLGAVRTVSVPEKAGAAAAYAFHCFPNPASDRLTIETTQPGTWTASLHEATGRRIWTHSSSGNQTFDTTDLQPGLYVLHIEGAGTRQYVKVLIAR